MRSRGRLGGGGWRRLLFVLMRLVLLLGGEETLENFLHCVERVWAVCEPVC
jgi:hypothetical protein